ncbi:hypothetical protein BD289DRAFT_77417 [Coniella lustricola]|uniref:Uncharacterized protein n=1 Tax=Coniella lustricola TaxID=2025994 RepID=A0A2T2ZZA8_9PEZI|nr:hypothetical protein BD289DRAFT_77417 [Coniella lustricola]
MARRQRVGQDHPQDTEASAHEAHADESSRPPQFWDRLSSIPLVKVALRELDRRSSTYTRTPAAVATTAVSGFSPTKRLPQLPLQITTGESVALARFARHGGPDLRALRGYPSIAPSPSQNQAPGSTRITRSRGRGQTATRRGRPRKASKNSRRLLTSSPVSTSMSVVASSSRASQSTTTTYTEKTRSSGPYDTAFAQQLKDMHIWPIDYCYPDGQDPPPPDNLHELQAMLRYSRASLPPQDNGNDGAAAAAASASACAIPNNLYQKFRQAHMLAKSKELISAILGLIEDKSLCLSTSTVRRGSVKPSNLDPIKVGAYYLVPGNPDRIYRARPEQLNVAISRELETRFLPTTAHNIVSPNFVVHVQGPKGSTEVANLLAVYNGAIAARAMESLSLYGAAMDCKEAISTTPQKTAFFT